MIDVQAASPTFLAWLARQAHHPDPLEFLATPDGTAMMPRDLERLVACPGAQVAQGGLIVARVCPVQDYERLTGIDVPSARPSHRLPRRRPVRRR
jgi:hypothetical protein